MTDAATWFLILFSTILLVVVYVAAVTIYYQRPTCHDEIFYAHTSDGWKIALLHFKATEGTTAKPYPVLFVHGLAANRNNFAFSGHFSPVRFMQERGFDCWVVELRGRGYSDKPHYWSWQRWRWTFDEYVDCDIASAIKKVLELTGKTKLDYVGHSMGGMILYAYAIKHPDHPIRRAVTLGANVRFKNRLKGHGPKIKFLLDKLPWINKLPYLPVRLWVYVNVFILGRIALPWSARPANPENMEPRLARRIFFNGIENISRRLLTENFADWVIHDSFVSSDRQIDYKNNLHVIKIPLRVIAGKVDFLADPENVRYAWEMISSAEKDYILLAKANGYSYDYGHVDMVFGKEADREVYPLIAGWLEIV